MDMTGPGVNLREMTGDPDQVGKRILGILFVAISLRFVSLDVDP
jgi:hypothetical protein